MAQSIVGTDLATTWAANSSRVCVRVRVDWDRDADFAAANENITARVAGLSIDHSLYSQLSGLPLLGGANPGKAGLQLLNEDRWFSPDNAAGLVATFPLIADGIFRFPIIIEIGYYGLDAAADYLTQFTGQIESADESESFGQAVVNVTCSDNSVTLLQYKMSTTVTSNVRPDTYIATLLAAGGLVGTSLDEGMTEIPYAWLDDENVWNECQAVAQADGGVFYMSKDGVATYRRMTALLEDTYSTVSQATLNSGNAKAYRNAIAWRDCYTGVIAEYAGRYLGTVTEVYQAPKAIEVPPGATVVEHARFRYPVLSVVTPVYGTDYNAVTSAPHTAPYGVTGVQLSITAYAQRAELSFTNNLASDTLHITDLVVRGYPLLGDEAQEMQYDTALSLIPGEKVYPLRGNPYVQTLSQVERVAKYLRDRLERPRRMLQWTGMACPWIELLDRVTLTHNTMTPNPGVNFDCYVMGIGMSYQAGGAWEQQLTLLPVADVFHHTDYFLIGTSVYADAASAKAAY